LVDVRNPDISTESNVLGVDKSIRLVYNISITNSSTKESNTMKTTETTILNVMYSNHRILIDKITEYDYNGDLAVAKKMCTVVRYQHDDDGVCTSAIPMVFNVSPYTSLVDMHSMAQAWIACGCPNNSDTIGGVPSKWTKENLHAWIAG
jgi:hypothetical protein